MSGNEAPRWKERAAGRAPEARAASKAVAGFAPAGFFVLRTPLLPFEELEAWGDRLAAPAALDEDPATGALGRALAADRELLRARLRAVVARPEVREALLVASPSLDESIPLWLAQPDGERGLKVERALVRYFARMAGRATPFGLFAGCSFGRTGAETRLAVDERARYGRHTRLDMDYLFSLGEALVGHADVRPHLIVRPNSSLYRAGARLRLAEARLNGRARTYHLVSVEPSDYLVATLRRAEGGARPIDLARALVEDDPDIALEEAEAYIGELIDAQVLAADLTPAVTGPEPVHALIAQLRGQAGAEVAALAAERLDQARAQLAELDGASLGSIDPPYRAIAGRLRDLPAPVELARLFQVDMTKPAAGAELGAAVLDEIDGAVRLLHRLAARSADESLRRFRDAFVARWEGREVPLVDALDEESGVGFLAAGQAGEAAPLLEGLAFARPAPPAAPPGPGFAHLVRRLEESAGAMELALDESDLRALGGRDEPPPLPDAFAVMCTLAAGSGDALARGEFRVHLRGVHGPSGANLLGRFCHGLPELEVAVKRLLAAEEAQRPDAIFAEVVHLPEGRIGNVLLRPVLRSHEIPFLGGSGAARDRHIPVGDLMVSIAGERIVLRSRRLGREVIPRLTSAHNYGLHSLGVYRFLCQLQGQGAARMGWSWGALDAAAFLPRVVAGKVVLSPARWRLHDSQLKPLARLTGEELYRAVQDLRARLRLPRHVMLTDGDNLLPIDLDSALSVETFVQLVKGRFAAVVSEMAPGPDELCAHGPEGRFVHELIIPYLRTPAASGAEDRPAARAVRTRAVARSFPPGSEWLFAKLYAGTATVDTVLASVNRVVRGALDSGAAGAWFFIRYADPDWHLRLRLRGDPARLAAEVLPALHAAAAPLLASGQVWRMQLDTYEREVERYGGDEAIEACERIFQADSDAVLAILDTLDGDEGADARWRIALAGVDRLLGDLAIEPPARLALVGRLRAGYGSELAVDAALERQLGEKYRKERLAIESLLSPDAGADHPLAPALAALAARSRAIAPHAAELRALAASGRLAGGLERVAASLVHMHANRLLHAAARAQELVLCDLLARAYTSREARARRAGGT
jgi:thiopeptide-type bacteriocin biosynthesis protein